MENAKCVVGRCQGGITLNGLEFLLDSNDELMTFENEDEAKDYLKAQGVSEDEIDTYHFIKEHEQQLDKKENQL
ncbi:hypothetical protein [Paenibacillus gallinarum]|uniref:Uncharacterized protein n=1 Tax=Paenibacillus gallinarum TaxID=2762232 RepID=A0ABR8T3H1_9BACL|nr:hypothetical protein [Paenibacillus gallinarum]MBD7970301.1 hypothetical protein [Paenibacillus gallinarum]